MNAWIDRLIDLGLAADAACWRPCVTINSTQASTIQSGRYLVGGWISRDGAGQIHRIERGTRGCGGGADSGDGYGGGWGYGGPMGSGKGTGYGYVMLGGD